MFFTNGAIRTSGQLFGLGAVPAGAAAPMYPKGAPGVAPVGVAREAVPEPSFFEQITGAIRPMATPETALTAMELYERARGRGVPPPYAVGGIGLGTVVAVAVGGAVLYFALKGKR